MPISELTGVVSSRLLGHSDDHPCSTQSQMCGSLGLKGVGM